MRITILTPIYNRKYIIEKLYKSLLKQTNNNFDWLIVDDGSNDGLKEWVNEKKRENRINIEYIYQENGGKHRALNTGIETIENELTFIVDSDDYLKENAIERINFYYYKYKNDKKICGFSFLRCNSNNKINGPVFKINEYKENYIQCRLNENNWGDKAEVYYTECLKKYPFLEVANERFLSECYVWAQLALKYDMIHINEAIYVCEYLKDGLTINMNKRKYESPIGYAETFRILCNNKANLKVKCKSMIIYIAYSRIANIKFTEQIKKTNYKQIFICMYPMGILYRKYVEYRIKKGILDGKRKEKYVK